MIHTIEEITQKITPFFVNKGIAKVILFGSYAKDLATENSDVDLMVEAEDWVDIFDLSEISVNVSEVLNKPVDFIAAEDVIPGGRTDLEIKSSGRVIYEKSDKELCSKYKNIVWSFSG